MEVCETTRFLQRGEGTDGGFGDYAPPYWEDEPVKTRAGSLIWFKDEKRAGEVAKLLSKRESAEFYAIGEHSEYDGLFPYEYKAVKACVPRGQAFDELSNKALLSRIPIVCHGDEGLQRVLDSDEDLFDAGPSEFVSCCEKGSLRIQLSDSDAARVIRALDVYSRIWTGQFERLVEAYPPHVNQESDRGRATRKRLLEIREGVLPTTSS